MVNFFYGAREKSIVQNNQSDKKVHTQINEIYIQEDC